MTVLSDGRVLIAGGSESGGEVGVNLSLTFDPSTRNFTTRDTMSERRWYPTCTALPNGKALVTSGSTYLHQWLFGGRAIPLSSTALTDSMQLYGQVSAGLWDPEVKDPGTGSTASWPTGREGHSAAYNLQNNETTIFGGLDTTGSASLSDTWYVYRLPDTDTGAHYSATKLTPPGTPSGRYRHSAVVPGDSTMIVFGGRSTLGLANTDVNELYKLAGTWTWRTHTPAGGPSAREGHTSIWDPENQCMLVFGGTTTNTFADKTPQDNTLYALTRGSAWTWTTATVDSDMVHGSPGPRHGHAMVVDAQERYVDATGAPDTLHERRALLFGGAFGGSTSAGYVRADSLLNDLWVLWIPKAGSGAHYLWRKVTPPGTAPSKRMRFAMFNDVTNDRLVISGGTVDSAAATATEYYLPLTHITASNDSSWGSLPPYAHGAVTGHTASQGPANWAFGQEVFDPSTGHWTAQGSRKRQDWYPFGFVAPQTDSVRIFYAGPDVQSYYYNLSAVPPYWRPFPATPTPTYRSGSAVMYLPGKVMRCGSRDTDEQFSLAVDSTKILDLQASPIPTAWTTTDTISARVNHNLVILPTGMVLAVGGTTTIHNPLNAGPVFRPQMWRPATATWTSMAGTDSLAADSAIRGYHSNAILLPDGRVLSISGTDTDDDTLSQGHLDAVRATVFCPPYLFDASGNLKTRPAITISSQTDYNTTFTVCVDNSGSAPALQSMCLIRPAASTHAFNMDQRYVPLTWQSQCQGRQLIVTSPANSSIAPPGDYLLFAVKTDSMPSIGQWIRLGVADEFPPTCLNCGGDGAAMIAGGDGGSDGAVLTGRNATTSASLSVAAVTPAPENALLVESSGERLYRLRTDPTAGTYAEARLIQDPGGQTTIDAATLSVVDHPSGTSAYAALDHVLVGVDVPVTSVTSSKNSHGAPITGSTTDSTPWIASDGDTLAVNLSDAPGTNHTPSRSLLIVARRGARDVFGSMISPDISILAPDGRGGETVLTKPEPRWAFDDIVVENCPARVRIAAGNGTQIQRIAQISSTDSSTVGTPLKLVKAAATGNPDVLSAVATVGGSSVSIAEGDTATMSWALPTSLAQGQVRTFFLRSVSTTVSTDSSLQTSSLSSQVAPAFVFFLRGARPNPFQGETTIDFGLARAGRASLRLYNVAGRLVRTLVQGARAAGPASIVWDGRDDRGSKVGGGVYFARLESGPRHSNRKMIFLGH